MRNLKLFSSDIAQYILDARNRAGFSLEQVAEFMQEPVSEIRLWESGEKPLSMEMLSRLTKLYGIPPAELSDFLLKQSNMFHPETI